MHSLKHQWQENLEIMKISIVYSPILKLIKKSRVIPIKKKNNGTNKIIASAPPKGDLLCARGRPMWHRA